MTEEFDGSFGQERNRRLHPGRPSRRQKPAAKATINNSKVARASVTPSIQPTPKSRFEAACESASAPANPISSPAAANMRTCPKKHSHDVQPARSQSHTNSDLSRRSVTE